MSEGTDARALEIALDCLRRLALPVFEHAGLETPLERMMREAAQCALDRIAIVRAGIAA